MFHFMVEIIASLKYKRSVEWMNIMPFYEPGSIPVGLFYIVTL